MIRFWNIVLEYNQGEQKLDSMLTKKGKYALKAMLHLATLRNAEIAQVAQIAEANNISKKFLDQIFADLRNVGLVHSTKGRFGGYALAKSPNEIKVGQIIRAIDGPIAPYLCASMTAYRPCDDCDEDVCAVRRLMIDARNALSNVFDTLTLADMLRQGQLKRRPAKSKQLKLNPRTTLIVQQSSPKARIKKPTGRA